MGNTCTPKDCCEAIFEDRNEEVKIDRTPGTFPFFNGRSTLQPASTTQQSLQNGTHPQFQHHGQLSIHSKKGSITKKSSIGGGSMHQQSLHYSQTHQSQAHQSQAHQSQAHQSNMGQSQNHTSHNTHSTHQQQVQQKDLEVQQILNGSSVHEMSMGIGERGKSFTFHMPRDTRQPTQSSKEDGGSNSQFQHLQGHHSINSQKSRRSRQASRHSRQFSRQTEEQVQSNMKNQDLQAYLAANIRFIVRIQAWIRGNRARKHTEAMKSKILKLAIYFTYDDYKETLSKGEQQHPGEFLSSPRNQKEYKFKSGAIYKGEWRGGFRDGYGVQTWPDGSRYEGEWQLNKAHGAAKFIHQNGDIFEGNFVNNKAHGYGVFFQQNGILFMGQWKHDLQHGLGYERWIDGSVYMGGYADGKKSGIGTYQWNEGLSYSGEWKDNKINGIGVHKWMDGRTYSGEWEDNNMHGLGIYLWADGRVFKGQYFEDKKQGYGIYDWNARRSYSGYWLNKQHGLGVFRDEEKRSVKYSLYEHGERRIVFKADQVGKINTGEMDYRTFFTHQESKDSEITSINSERKMLQEPTWFYAALDKVQSSCEGMKEALLEQDGEIRAILEQQSHLNARFEQMFNSSR